MCVTDKYPTEYNLRPVTLERSPSITDYELAALKGIDLAERAAEPINRFSVARIVVRLGAHIARRTRHATR